GLLYPLASDVESPEVDDLAALSAVRPTLGDGPVADAERLGQPTTPPHPGHEADPVGFDLHLLMLGSCQEDGLLLLREGAGHRDAVPWRGELLHNQGTLHLRGLGWGHGT